jgi:hypothetical protein
MKNPIKKEVIDHWNYYYPRLSNYKKLFGHCDVPPGWAHDPKLARWLELVRGIQSRLPSPLRNDLLKLGLDLNYDNYSWGLMYKEFKSFVKKHKSAIIPASDPRYKHLSQWVQLQRNKRKNLSLTKERIALLDKAGIVWEIQSARDQKWYGYYKELAAYKRRYRDCLVPRQWEKNRDLGAWVERQRTLQVRMKLRPDRKGLLDQLGFLWTGKHPIKKIVFDKVWEKGFKQLTAFHKKYNHISVPYEWKENPSLSRWIGDQRLKYNKGKLGQEKIERLEAIGFTWDPIEDHWIERYQALADFKKKHGHLRIPLSTKEYKSLHKYAYYLRTQRKKLPVEKIQMLNKLGFEWAIREKAKVSWMEMYKALVKYKKKHGHLKLKRSENTQLYMWVYHLKTRRITLSKEKDLLLKKIGFEF